MLEYEWPHWATFLSAALLLNVSPGPDIAFIVGQTVARGRASGFAAMFGIWTGDTAFLRKVMVRPRGRQRRFCEAAEIFLRHDNEGGGCATREGNSRRPWQTRRPCSSPRPSTRSSWMPPTRPTSGITSSLSACRLPPRAPGPVLLRGWLGIWKGRDGGSRSPFACARLGFGSLRRRAPASRRGRLWRDLTAALCQA